MDAVEHATTPVPLTTHLANFSQWLRRPETREQLDRLTGIIVGVAIRIDAAFAEAGRAYQRTVERDKRARLAAVLASGDLHRADVEGLLSLDAPQDVVERAVLGGRARRRVHLYRQPIDVMAEKVIAFNLMTTGKPEASPDQRRAAFEIMPFRDEIMHAVIRAALDAAGPGNRDEGYASASCILSAARAGRMTGTTPSSARKIYRRVSRRMREEGWDKTFSPISAIAFTAWIEEGTVPPSFQADFGPKETIQPVVAPGPAG